MRNITAKTVWVLLCVLFISQGCNKDKAYVQPLDANQNGTQNLQAVPPEGTYPIPPQDLYTRPESEIIFHLQPLVNAGRYKMQQYGFNPDNYFSGPNDLRFAEAAMAIDRLEQLYGEGKEVTYSSINPPIRDSFSAMNTYDCGLRAFGIEAMVVWAQGGLGKVPPSVVRGALIRLGSRTLGVVGTAWAAYEFGGCMGWY